jgi:hypothetical protein
LEIPQDYLKAILLRQAWMTISATLSASPSIYAR